MLCEKCHEREATIHFVIVAGFSDEVARHEICDACYPVIQAERLQTYNSQANSPPPADVENITALEYLAASARAACNGVDKPAFGHIHEELKRFPKTRQRLAFEMLQWAWQQLERGEAPGLEIGFVVCARGSIDKERLAEYADWLEKIANRCFELYAELPNPPAAYNRFSFELGIVLTALRKVDKSKFTTIFQTLKSECERKGLNSCRKVLAQVGEIF